MVSLTTVEKATEDNHFHPPFIQSASLTTASSLEIVEGFDVDRTTLSWLRL